MHPLKRLWLQTWPKLLVTGFGVACYMGAVYLPEAHRHLAQGIAVNLISIPIIFLLYQFWNDRSRQRLYEHIYRYAEREMASAMEEAKSQVQSLLFGIEIYIRDRPLVLDDGDVPAVSLRLHDYARIDRDEDGTLHLVAGDQAWQFYEDEDEDLFSFEKDTIALRIAGSWYVGHQVFGFQVDKAVERVDNLIRNTFVMEKMDDREATVIVALHQSLRALDAFIGAHEDLFLSTDVQAGGLVTDHHATHLPGMLAVELVLDVNDVEQRNYRETLNSGLYGADRRSWLERRRFGGSRRAGPYVHSSVYLMPMQHYFFAFHWLYSGPRLW